MPMYPPRIRQVDVVTGQKYNIVARLETDAGAQVIAFIPVTKGQNNAWPNKKWKDTVSTKVGVDEKEGVKALFKERTYYDRAPPANKAHEPGHKVTVEEKSHQVTAPKTDIDF